MRHLTVSLTTLALLAVSAIGAVAQEDEPPPGGAFGAAGSLSLARTGHTATLLPDGRVLIVGGEGVDLEDLATAELWDPATATFGPAEQLAEPRTEPLVEADIERTGHSATLLPDGRALVIGGSTTDDPTLMAAAEILDPESGELVPAGTLAEPRTGHTATFLRDGRVLVVGGSGPDGALASAEVWTSATRPLKCLGKRPTLVAQPGVELFGSKGSDIIAGSIGDDIISGGDGNDRICGYGGGDTIDGGGGSDMLDGGPGADTITGAGGNDRLTGSAGDDTLDGGKGKDVCVGGKGTDWLPGCNDRKKTRGTVIVTKNTKLKGPHRGRFVIGKDGVTLDCDGHTVTGAGQDVDPLAGVLLVGRKNVTVRNCHLEDHFFGFLLHDSNRNAFIRNRAAHVGDGFNLVSSDANKLVENVITDTSYSGVALFDGSDRNRIVENVVTDIEDIGFFLQSASGGNRVVGNSASGARHSGFVTDSSGNEFIRNSATHNSGPGFVDTSSGFKGDAGTNNTYTDNTCAANSGGDSSPGTLCD